MIPADFQKHTQQGTQQLPHLPKDQNSQQKQKNGTPPHTHTQLRQDQISTQKNLGKQN